MEILEVHQLADLDRPLAVWRAIRRALHPLDRLGQRVDFDDREACDELFDSVNGPSMTLRWSPLNSTRVDVGVSPSAARRIPAFTAASLYFCIAANASGFGGGPGGPALDSCFAMAMMRKRIVLSWIRFVSVAAPSRPH